MSHKWLSNEEIARKVSEIRRTLGDISQHELARRIGRPGSQSEISKYEKGKKDPEPGILLDLAALVGRGLDYFQEEVGPEAAERERKLAIADWLEEAAKNLRKEAIPLPIPAGVKPAARSDPTASELKRTAGIEPTQPRAKPGRKRVPGER